MMRMSARAFYGLLLLVFLTCPFAGCSNSTGGSTTITDRFNGATVSQFQIVPVTASCNPGEQMLSGGWAVTTPAYDGPVTEGQPHPNDDQQYFVAGSFPSGPSSWTAIFTNNATGNSKGDVFGAVHVECLSKGVSPTIVTQLGTDPSSSSVTTPSCPNGSALTGGGFKLTNFTNISSQMIDIGASFPYGVSQWFVSTDFTLGSIMQSGQDVEAFAVCSTDLATSFTQVTVKAPYAPSTQPTVGTASASCTDGEVPVASGYGNGNNDNAFPITTFYPDYEGTPPQWDVRAYALPFIPIDSAPYVTGGSATIKLLCAKLP